MLEFLIKSTHKKLEMLNILVSEKSRNPTTNQEKKKITDFWYVEVLRILQRKQIKY